MPGRGRTSIRRSSEKCLDDWPVGRVEPPVGSQHQILCLGKGIIAAFSLQGHRYRCFSVCGSFRSPGLEPEIVAGQGIIGFAYRHQPLDNRGLYLIGDIGRLHGSRIAAQLQFLGVVQSNVVEDGGVDDAIFLVARKKGSKGQFPERPGPDDGEAPEALRR